MAKRILEVSEFTFTPSLGKIAFAVAGFSAARVLVVLNLTAGSKIYAVGLDGYGFRSVTGSTITLQADTSSMTSGDTLLAIYDDPGGQAVTGPLTDAQLRAAAVSVTSGTLASDATVQQVLAAIRAQRVETILTDDTGTRFIRLDNAGTISWTDVTGAASPAPGAGARPDSDSGTVVSRSTYRATAAGTGFASGDILDHLVVTDGDAGDLVSNFWIDVSTGTKIAAPASASITPMAPLPDGAATAAKQDTGNASLASLDGKLPALGPKASAGSVSVTLPADGQFALSVGLPADAAATSDAGSFSLIAFVKRGLANWTTLLARVPALVSGRMPVDGSGVTQPVSATALPLPAGASTLANDNIRATYQGDIGPGTLNASTTGTNPARDAGATPSAFTRFNASFSASTQSTCIIQGSDDNTQWFDVYQGTTATPGTGAGYGSLTPSVPVVFRYYRTRIISGASAASVYVKSGFSVA